MTSKLVEVFILQTNDNIRAAREVAARDGRDGNGLKIFSISGSQGTGKTTVFNEFRKLVESRTDPKLNKLIDEHGEFYFVERKTSRSIQGEMEISSDELFKNPELIKDFQINALSRKAYDDIVKPYQEGYRIAITERSPIDLAAYTIAHLGFYPEYNDFINQYVEEALQIAKLYYPMLLMGGLFDIENDGIRPINTQYQLMIENTQRSLLSNGHSTNIWELCATPSLGRRVEAFNTLIKDATGVRYYD